MAQNKSEETTTPPENENKVKEYLGTETLKAFQDSCYKLIKEGVVASNRLPKKPILTNLVRVPEFKNMLNQHQCLILDTLQMMLNLTGTSRRISQYHDSEKLEVVVDANDFFLDRASFNMDILEGIRTAEAPENFHRFVSGSWNKSAVPNPGAPAAQVSAASKITPNKSLPDITLHMTKGTVRPQVNFKDKVNNSSNPWVPMIKEKPNSLKPLAIMLEVNEKGYESYCHPYEYELDLWKPPESQMEFQQKVVKPKVVEETDYEYIETEEQLNKLLSDLLSQKEIAIDLEHHSYRSFLGFTCVMQISTHNKDYIVDTLCLRDKLHILNEVFTKPTILKVFHGADNDIVWLQKDFNLYVVNMFDTYQACKFLEFPRLNLAYLLKHYCGVEANKHFQLYDWRTRPLSETALKYAREDTHYLLYIYAKMRNELLQKVNGQTNLLEAVYQRSTETCKKTFTKPLLEEDSHMLLYRKGRRLFDNKQMYALKELYRWRDKVAREQDESVGYVLPNHMMMQIAENLPREMQGILACCNPIPPAVRQNLLDLHKIMLCARDQPTVKVISDVRSAEETGDGFQRNKALNFVHDLEQWEFRDDLPTLLDKSLEEIGDPPPMMSNFPFYENGEDETTTTPNSRLLMIKLNDIENAKFLSPYQRYKKVLPYVNKLSLDKKAEEDKEREALAKKKAQEQSPSVRKELTQNFIKFEEHLPPKTLSEQVKLQKRKFEGPSQSENDSFNETPRVKKEKHKNKKRKVDNGKPDLKTEEAEPSTEVRPVQGVGVISVEINTTEGRNNYRNYHQRNRQEQMQPSNTPGRGKSIPRNQFPRPWKDEAPSSSNWNASQRNVFPRPWQKEQSSNNAFKPYDYKNVDFGKFQSNAGQGSSNRNRDKRKQEFRGQNNPKRHRGRRGHF